MKNILVLYSTTDGHTLTICKRIKNYLNQLANITLISLFNYKKEELENYDIIIVGASIRYGKHNPRVKEFVINNLQLLKNKQNAFFTVNVVARKTNKNTPETNPYLIKFLNSISWKPDIVDVFAGRLDYPSISFWDKQMIRLIMYMTKGPTDTKKTYEFTDWKRVESFALKISKLLN
ncbi:MAG: menaquinone-dependent protoporphyrinogen IX dehydrogenase [Paracoccaceae bacterium]